MVSRHKHKGYTIDYFPDDRKMIITVLAKVLKTFTKLPRAVALCHAKLWIDERIDCLSEKSKK